MMSPRSRAGITPRILSSTAWKICSVRSIRVRAGARTWSWIRPASTWGKKSVPTWSERVSAPAMTASAAGGVARLLAAQQQADDDRRQRAGDDIGGDHGEDHRHAQRGEEVEGRPLEEEEDRDEDAADRQGRDQGG